jgi:hypothetical protein
MMERARAHTQTHRHRHARQHFRDAGPYGRKYIVYILFIGILFIGSLKAGFVTERSKPGSCRAFRFQYPIFSLVLHISCLLDLVLKPNECLCCVVLTF